MMSPLLILLFGVLRLCVSIPNCDWAYLNGEYIALNICQKYFRKDEFNSNLISYTIECNDNGSGLQYKYFTESSTCQDNGINVEIEPLSALSIKDTFHCHINKTTCNSMTYRRYNECPYNNNTSYTDSNLLTNTCIIDEKLEISKSITCNSNDNSYSINTFNDTVCDTKNILDTNVIYMNNTNPCTQIIHCDSSSDTPISTPINTPAHTAVNNCKFINYNGTGYRIDICNENVINSQLYSYKFHCNGIGNVVSISYYQNTNKCNADNLFLSLPITITDESVIGFQCDLSDYMNTNIHTTCDPSNYMQLKMYENDCSVDTTEYNEYNEYNEYTTHDIITGHCLKDTNNNYCLYECGNNNNYTENGYFAIKYFNNHLCEGEPYNIIAYSESDCYNNKLTHMIWCNGVNTIHVPVIDYNHFVDDYIGQGKPLNICSNKIIMVWCL